MTNANCKRLQILIEDPQNGFNTRCIFSEMAPLLVTLIKCLNFCNQHHWRDLGTHVECLPFTGRESVNMLFYRQFERRIPNQDGVIDRQGLNDVRNTGSYRTRDSGGSGTNHRDGDRTSNDSGRTGDRSRIVYGSNSANSLGATGSYNIIDAVGIPDG